MSNTKNNHYLSQSISKNFKIDEHAPLWEYDFATHMGPRVRSIEKLFAGRRLWGQELEDTIGSELESKLALILKKLTTNPVERYRKITSSTIEEIQFNGFIIESDEEQKILSKLMLQTILLQQSSIKLKNPNSDARLQSFFKSENCINMNVALIEINPLIHHPPLILIDGMMFMFLVPETNNSEMLGHICFMFPINAERLLLWGNKSDVDYFAMRYRNIDYLNLCRIEQHKKMCKIATQDKEYLDSLVKRVPSFSLGNDQVQISICRE